MKARSPLLLMTYLPLGFCLLLVPLGCSEDEGDGDSDGDTQLDEDSEGDASNSGGKKGQGITDIEVTLNGSGGAISWDIGGQGGQGGQGPYKLPPNFENAEFGGWRVGDEIDDNLVQKNEPTGDCGTQITGVVRDFRRGDQEDGHADFETFLGQGEQGILEERLGEDLKPVLAPGDHEFTTTQEAFDQWFHTTEDVNRAYLVDFSFEPNGDVLTFQSRAFFPLDGLGHGNQGQEHNFGFTTEIHTEFLYRGGESFGFLGDDDLWVYVNGHLAIDLGGLHREQSATLSLDDRASDLNIEIGNTYSLSLFHAERHSGASNFRVDTNLEFTRCSIIVPDILPVR